MPHNSLNPTPQPPIPATIGVIVGRDQVGDGLIKLPFLRALRHAFPQSKIHWITSQGPTAYATILWEATKGLIDAIHEQPDWIRWPVASGRWSEKKDSGHRSPATDPFFDLLIDTRNRWREALQARKIPHGLFLALAARFLLSEKRPSSWLFPPEHMVDRLLQLVELASNKKPQPQGAVSLRPELVEMARKILPDGKTYVGLATGAGNPIKIWPRYKFEMLARLQADKGRVPVFILGPQEQADFAALSALLPTARFPLQEMEAAGTFQLTIDHTFAIASLLDVAVANDSGVGHMLAAADCPLISLFGPTSADKLAPSVSRGMIISAQDFGDKRMKAITWEAVDQAVDRFLPLKGKEL